MVFHPTLHWYGRFFLWPLLSLMEFMGNHYPETLLKIRYYLTFKKRLNLDNPQDLNEKILWAKLYSDTSRWVELADKRRVRDYVEKIGLGGTLVKLYATWYKEEDVDFSALPESFIIKANNGDGKGTNLIIHKSELTPQKEKKYIKIIGDWLKRKNIGSLSAEPQYNKMRPCVIAEEVLPVEEDATSLTDYKMWCFNGKFYCVIVYSNRNADGNSAQIMNYDASWKAHPEHIIYTSDYLQGNLLPKPQNWERMIQIAEKLAQGFPEVRVDLYNINGKIYFGEMTFSSHGGFHDIFTPEYLKELGSKFEIADFPIKNKA